MKVLIAISSCKAYEDSGLNDPIRTTWMPDARALGIDCLFFHGQGADPKADVVVLDVPDGYEHMSYKTRESLRWALQRGYDFVFRCFADTYVCPSRLMSCGFQNFDYFGDFSPLFFCCGGHGYMVSKKAMQYLVDAPIDPTVGPWHENWKEGNAGAEDIWVGITLNKHPDITRGDIRKRFIFEGRIYDGPQMKNTVITSHLSDPYVRGGYKPEYMYDKHREWQTSWSHRPLRRLR